MKRQPSAQLRFALSNPAILQVQGSQNLNLFLNLCDNLNLSSEPATMSGGARNLESCRVVEKACVPRLYFVDERRVLIMQLLLRNDRLPRHMVPWAAGEELSLLEVKVLGEIEADLLTILFHVVERLRVDIGIELNLEHVDLAPRLIAVHLAPHPHHREVG